MVVDEYTCARVIVRWLSAKSTDPNLPQDKFTLTQLATQLFGISSPDRSVKNKLAAILRKLGFRSRRGHGSCRIWCRPDTLDAFAQRYTVLLNRNTHRANRANLLDAACKVIAAGTKKQRADFWKLSHPWPSPSVPADDGPLLTDDPPPAPKRKRGRPRKIP